MSRQINQIYEFGDFRLDTCEQLLLRRGEPVPLTRKAFDTLLVLVESNGHLVDKDELLRRVWTGTFVEEANLARNVWALRKALDDDNGKHRYIETVPKRGYRFIAPIRLVPVEEPGVLIQRRMTAHIVTEELENSEPPQSEIQTVVEPKRSTRTIMRPGQKRRLALIALSVVIVAAAIGAWFLSRTSPPIKIGSMAILPFQALSQEEKNQALGLGLTDALITKFGGLHVLTVRPTSAVTKFARSNLDALEIGKLLKVDSVLEGSIQQSEGRIRIRARLLRVNSGEQLWAEEFDESANEIFALEDKLSNKIANTLAFEVGKSELQQLTSRPTNNSDAYDKYLRGRFYQMQNDEQGFLRSIELYEQAIALDPNFADAYAGLADANLLLYNFGLRTSEQVFPKAWQSIVKALQLNPNLQSAYNSLALIQFFDQRDFKAAEQSLRKALEIDPHDADAMLRYGYFLLVIGNFDEGLKRLDQAQALNPLSPIVQTDIGLAYLLARRYPEAIVQLEKVASENPDFSLSLWLLATAYDDNGNFEKGFDLGMRALQTDGDSQLASQLRGFKDTKGLTEATRSWLDEWLKAKEKGERIPSLSIASRYALFKDREQTLNWLERARREHDLTLSQIKYLARYDFVRDDPRFQNILQEISFKEN